MALFCLFRSRVMRRESFGSCVTSWQHCCPPPIGTRRPAFGSVVPETGNVTDTQLISSESVSYERRCLNRETRFEKTRREGLDDLGRKIQNVKRIGREETKMMKDMGGKRRICGVESGNLAT